jgi:hypothetical protein
MAKNESRSVAEALEVDVNAIAHALATPFEATEVKFKPQTVSGNRALAVPFVDARVIQDRLDEVLGVMGWQDSYECLPDGAVVCRLRIRLGAEWITKEDVGGQSEQPDEGDRRKAAFSDALKRAAVKFGIGRYLYRQKPQWVDYDPQKRQFLRAPTLPSFSRDAESSEPSAAKELAATLKMPEAPAAPPEKKSPKSRPAAKAEEKPAAPAAQKAALEARCPAPRGKPTNGAELQKRLYEKDASLAQAGVCKPGELVKHVVQAGVKAGYEADLATWSGAAIELAISETRVFEGQRRQPAGGEKVA